MSGDKFYMLTPSSNIVGIVEVLGLGQDHAFRSERVKGDVFVVKTKS